MKTSKHQYKGYLITGFNLRQLGDREVSGMSYNVYLKEGGESLSVTECLRSLAEAKDFVNGIIAEGGK